MAVVVLALMCSFKLVMGKQEGFIVGGNYVDSIKEFPHVAFLTLSSEDGYFLCGSSVLNQVILVTAAHCFDNAHEVTAAVGNINRKKGMLYRVKSFKQHTKWDLSRIINDIALCRLKKPLPLGHVVKRVVLMKKPPKAQTADLAGWGVTDEWTYSETILLKHTRQKMWTHDQCKKVLFIPKGTICGGERRAKGNFAAEGDSGSGLLVYKNIIVGLVSYKDAAISRSLVVYTDVTYFYDWILRESRRLACL